MEKAFTDNPSTTCSALAKKLKIFAEISAEIKVNELGSNADMKKTVPNYIKDQEIREKPACRKTDDKLSEKVVIIANEI